MLCVDVDKEGAGGDSGARKKDDRKTEANVPSQATGSNLQQVDLEEGCAPTPASGNIADMD